MAADFAAVRSTYVAEMQAACTQLLACCATLDALNTLYVGAGLSGTFLDPEMVADPTRKHLTAADVGTITANLQTVRAAVTAAVQQNLAKAAGK